MKSISVVLTGLGEASSTAAVLLTSIGHLSLDLHTVTPLQLLFCRRINLFFLVFNRIIDLLLVGLFLGIVCAPFFVMIRIAKVFNLLIFSRFVQLDLLYRLMHVTPYVIDKFDAGVWVAWMILVYFYLKCHVGWQGIYRSIIEE